MLYGVFSANAVSVPFLTALFDPVAASLSEKFFPISTSLLRAESFVVMEGSTTPRMVTLYVSFFLVDGFVNVIEYVVLLSVVAFLSSSSLTLSLTGVPEIVTLSAAIVADIPLVAGFLVGFGETSIV